MQYTHNNKEIFWSIRKIDIVIIFRPVLVSFFGYNYM